MWREFRARTLVVKQVGIAPVIVTSNESATRDTDASGRQNETISNKQGKLSASANIAQKLTKAR